ncbi:MAG TPA: KH domain-containing protein [Candidatus Saccharimonadales bacterium]|nr:KH domain-containing protein [Candidatus Saccharimonadales bacterium]
MSTTSIDQQFVEFVIKSLVNNPDAVQVERRVDEKGVLLELTVDPEDLGRVIGKRGATAQSLRTLLRALGTKNDARYNLKIVDNGIGGGYSSDDAAQTTAVSSSSSATDDLADLRDEDDHATAATAKESDRITQTRKELDELDDLDI